MVSWGLFMFGCFLHHGGGLNTCLASWSCDSREAQLHHQNFGCTEVITHWISLQVFGEKPTPEDDMCYIDIASDDLSESYYKKSEDLRTFCSVKTGRGPLLQDWQETTQPIMCSYKLVAAKFEVYGFQSRVESFIHKNIKDILLAGHRQAVAWMDEWYGMSLEDVRKFEKRLQEETNCKVNCQKSSDPNSEHLLNTGVGKHSINRSTSWNNGTEASPYGTANGNADSKPRPRLPSAPE